MTSQIESSRWICYIRLYKNGIKEAKYITIETTRSISDSATCENFKESLNLFNDQNAKFANEVSS